MNDKQYMIRQLEILEELEEDLNCSGSQEARMRKAVVDMRNTQSVWIISRKRMRIRRTIQWIIIILCSALILYFAMSELPDLIEVVDFWRY